MGTKQQDVGTIVGSSVHLTGIIKDTSDIVIYGSVEGEIHSEQKIIIEESAFIKGPVHGGEVIISGTVVGTIAAKNRLELNQNGTIKGNIDTSELLIHAGATFIGKSNMPDKKGTDKGTIHEGEFAAEVEDPAEAEKEKEEKEKDAS